MNAEVLHPFHFDRVHVENKNLGNRDDFSDFEIFAYCAVYRQCETHFGPAGNSRPARDAEQVHSRIRLGLDALAGVINYRLFSPL